MLTVKFEAEGLFRKFDTLAERASDLDVPFRKFGAHLRRRAFARYKAQDFAQLAAGTLEHRAQKGVRGLERKLHRDLKKAIGRARADEPRGGLLFRLLGAKSAAVDMKAVDSRGAKNRMAVLAEFQRRHRPGGSLAARGDLKELSLKQLVSLGKREDRAVGKAVSKPILGGLSGTLEVTLDGRGNVTLASTTRYHWSEIHNKGGTAGHGAKEPQRETIKVEPDDLDVLQQILKDHLLLPLEA